MNPVASRLRLPYRRAFVVAKALKLLCAQHLAYFAFLSFTIPSTLQIYAPKGVRAMYLSRMRWALSSQDLDEFSEQLDVPQRPPPHWQLTCLLDHGLTTFVSANSNWMGEPNSLDLYTDTELAPALPIYKRKVPMIETDLLPHQVSSLCGLRG